jgi:hypothetical protein
VQYFGPVRIPRGGSPVPVQYQRPAPAVNHHLMVVRAQQDALVEAGRTAVSLVLYMVHLTACRGLVTAAGPPAPPVPQDHRVADPWRDRLGEPDVQGQARPGQAGAQLLGPQE